jgi:hypothetical protein
VARYQDCRRLLMVEREPPAEQEEADGAQRIEDAAPVERIARPLLGTHEVDRAHDVPGLREARRLRRLCDPKVGDDQPIGPAFEQEVVGLHVAMDDAAGVRVGEGPGRVPQQSHRRIGRERPQRLDSFAERFPVDEGHGEVGPPRRFVGRVDGDDVGVGELRGGACLAQESLADRGVGGERRGEDLEGDRAGEAVARAKTTSSRAPQLADDGVVPGRAFTGRGILVRSPDQPWAPPLYEAKVRFVPIQRQGHVGTARGGASNTPFTR